MVTDDEDAVGDTSEDISEDDDNVSFVDLFKIFQPFVFFYQGV